MLTSVARTEVVAALTAVAVLAPETVAFAQIAGVPPAWGLAAAPLCVLAYAVLGRSRRLVVGATAATGVICAAAVQAMSDDPAQRARLVATLAVMTGVLLVLTGLLRGGFVAHFLAPEAVRGFLFGLAVVIVIRQIAVMVDVPTAGNGFTRSWDVLRAVPDWSAASLVTGLVAVAALLVLETRFPRVPATLVVLTGAAAGAEVLQLRQHGVQFVAEVPPGVPVPRLPEFGADSLLGLAPTAAGLALVVFVLGHGIAERVRERDERALDANREMVGAGVANVVAGLVGGLAVAGSPSASAAAREIGGGRNRWMLVLSAVLLLVVALVLTPAFTRLPEPVLAAVVIMAVRPFLAIRPLRAYLARDRRAFAVATSAVLGVAEFTLVSGLLIAVGLSLLIFVADASRLRISILGRQPDSGAYLPVDMFPDAIAPAGASVLRPDGQLFFANVGRLTAAVDAELSRPGPISRVLVIDLGASFELRLDVIDALARIRRRVIDHDRAFVFAHLRPDALAAAAKSDLAGVTTFANLDAAVAEAAALAASVSRSGRISDRIVNRAGTAGEP